MIRITYLRQIIKIKQYFGLYNVLLWTFIFLISTPSALSAHSSSFQSSIDSVQMESLDTPAVSTFDYVFIDTAQKPTLNFAQDSVLRMIEIEYTDLEAWFHKMDKLKKDKDMSPVLKKAYRPSWLIGVLLVILICLGMVRVFFYPTFLNIIYGYYNERILLQISKEDNVLTSWPYIFLYMIFSLSLGLFAVIYFGAKQDISFLTFNNFIRLSGFIGVLFVAKLLLIRIISVIFEAEKLARDYITVLYVVYFNSMIFLTPLLIFAIFLPFFYLDYLLIFLVVCTVLLFSYRLVRTAWSLLGNLKFSIFYLILYLCALEIAPILILVKTLTNK